MKRLGAVAAMLVLAAVGAGAATSGHALTIYAVATKGQYANHADDRARGVLDNPFNADEDKPTGNGKASRAGDNALIALKLYSDSSFKKQIGSGTYSCTFTTGKVALCEADFELNDGAMTASGPTNFARHDIHPRGERRHREVPRRPRPGLLGASRQGAPAHVRLPLSPGASGSGRASGRRS